MRPIGGPASIATGRLTIKPPDEETPAEQTAEAADAASAAA